MTVSKLLAIVAAVCEIVAALLAAGILQDKNLALAWFFAGIAAFFLSGAT